MLNSDARHGLVALLRAAKTADIKKRSDWLNTIEQEREAWQESVTDQRRSDLAPLHYARVCDDTARVVQERSPDLPVFFDTGHLLSFAPPFFTASSRYISHNGFFHRMGWSASAIVGASIARGDAPALALIGDGSFLMGGVAVATAVEQSLPIVWVVLNNRTLQIERELMFRLFGRESLCDYRKKGEPGL